MAAKGSLNRTTFVCKAHQPTACIDSTERCCARDCCSEGTSRPGGWPRTLALSQRGSRVLRGWNRDPAHPSPQMHERGGSRWRADAPVHARPRRANPGRAREAQLGRAASRDTRRDQRVPSSAGPPATTSDAAAQAIDCVSARADSVPSPCIAVTMTCPACPALSAPGNPRDDRVRQRRTRPRRNVAAGHALPWTADVRSRMTCARGSPCRLAFRPRSQATHPAPWHGAVVLPRAGG